MSRLVQGTLAVVLLAVLGGAVFWARRAEGPAAPAPAGSPAAAATQPAVLAGSQSCRECHERFYGLWSTSHHGLAMQPFTPAFAQSQLTGQSEPIKVGQNTYRVQISDQGGWVIENGPQGEKRFDMLHVMGGKNIFYFLTALERGRLQVLPLAFDVGKKAWFDAPASAVRHFREAAAEVLDWRDPAFTFNTSCHGCHVSQLAKNYDLASDTYHTTWSEPGINCETCHGPASEHVLAAKALAPGQKLADPKLIVTRTFSAEQHNSTCAPCHAKMMPLSSTFRPGDRYFDHFDLATLEDPDFYPDGRDLGENYTYTSWRMSPCAQSGQLHCVNCHTSSGRYRFKGENANHACLPCHKQHVEKPTEHTHHKADSPGNLCVSCHMPMTGFARMRRSDHSMRPPTPAATIAFKSPNACNICHADHDAAWADQQVRQWRKRDYQAPVLHRAGLLAAARGRNWARLPEMLQQITDKQRDEVYATSFLRLLRSCPDERKWPAFREAMKDPSPLVRSAAAGSLGEQLDQQNCEALLTATGDEYRLVRLRAAGALAGYPPQMLGEKDRRRLEAAWGELEASFAARPDDWSAQYNLGSFHADQGRPETALKAYELATRLRPDVVPPLVNASLIYASLGQTQRAENVLKRALAIEPANAAGNFNMGLLQGELGDAKQAEQHLRAALKADPNFAEAAYNLGVLIAADRAQEALGLLNKAYTLRPNDPKYAYTLAFYLNAQGNGASAADVLKAVIAKAPGYVDAYMLLGAIHEQQMQFEQARALYRQALGRPEVPPNQRRGIQARLQAIEGR